MKMVPDIAVLFDLDGNRRRLDYRKVPFQAWSQVKQAGFTPMTLIDQGLMQFDLDAIACVMFLDKAQSDRRASVQDTFKALMAGDDAEFELVDILEHGRSLLGGDDDPSADGDEVPPTTSGS